VAAVVGKIIALSPVLGNIYVDWWLAPESANPRPSSRYTTIKKPLDLQKSGRTILVKIKHAELRPNGKEVKV
jgi:hypothetical protein